MSRKYKTSYKSYAAWDYTSEIRDLDRASEQGWQLVRGGCFHSRFTLNPEIRYRYQLDYRKVEDLGRYIEMFREQGWEYVNSTFNNWHYFRKIWDPSLPESAYEIFTDTDSLQEMTGRWSRLATILGVILAGFSLFWIILMMRHPELPTLLQLLMFAVESAVLLRGGTLMRYPEKRRGRTTNFVGIFLAVILLGCAASLTLTVLRPDLQSQQNADVIEEPIRDNRWISFRVSYPDYYYLDLKIEAEEPLTFEIVDAAGETVYSKTATSCDEDDIRLRLKKGEYSLSMSADSGFELDTSIS